MELTEWIFDGDASCCVTWLSISGLVDGEHTELHLLVAGQILDAQLGVLEGLTIDLHPAWTVSAALLNNVALDGGTTVIARCRPGQVNAAAGDVLSGEVTRSGGGC